MVNAVKKIFTWLHLYPKPEVKGESITNKYDYLREEKQNEKFIKD